MDNVFEPATSHEELSLFKVQYWIKLLVLERISATARERIILFVEECNFLKRKYDNKMDKEEKRDKREPNKFPRADIRCQTEYIRSSKGAAENKEGKQTTNMIFERINLST